MINSFGSGAKKDHAIDLAGLRNDGRIACGASSHAAANNRYRHSACLSQIPDGSKHIQMERRVHWVGITRPVRLTITAEVKRKHAKTRRREGSRLLFPALFFEATAVSQHHGTVPLAVEVSKDRTAVLARKGDGFLSGGN